LANSLRVVGAPRVGCTAALRVVGARRVGCTAAVRVVGARPGRLHGGFTSGRGTPDRLRGSRATGSAIPDDPHGRGEDASSAFSESKAGALKRWPGEDMSGGATGSCFARCNYQNLLWNASELLATAILDSLLSHLRRLKLSKALTMMHSEYACSCDHGHPLRSASHLDRASRRATDPSLSLGFIGATRRVLRRC
jgi:hypothetical protein